MSANQFDPANIDLKSRQMFKEGLDAMTKWRDEMTALTERNSTAVFDKLGEAAKAVGWPDSIVTTTKQQMLNASKMQSDMMDHMVKAWQDQLKSPGNTGPFLGSLPTSLKPPFGGNNPMDFTNLAMAPTQIMLQSMEIWRKNWMDAMSMWTGGKR